MASAFGGAVLAMVFTFAMSKGGSNTAHRAAKS
jgi:hypothetical protein